MNFKSHSIKAEKDERQRAFNVRKKAGSACSRMSAALVHSTCADNFFALDAAFVRSTFSPVQQASYIALHKAV